MDSRGHALILGASRTGKSTLGKMMAQNYMDNGTGVLVYDPIGDVSWPHHLKTDDIAEFNEWAKTEWECALFVDEASEVTTVGQRENHWLATRARHRGHRTHVLSQRAPGAIAPIVRDQCTDLFLFQLAPKDCVDISRDFNRPEILDQGPELPQGTCLHIARFQPTNRLVIFDPNSSK